MDTDTKLGLSQEGWKALPGLDKVPTLPKRIATDIYTKLLLENEAAWLSIANLFKECNMEKNVEYAYERALANNPMSKEALQKLGPLYRRKKLYGRALDVFLRLYKLAKGEDMLSAANIGFCYLMLDNFPDSLTWYKVAARNAAHIREDKGFLWFGIGILYERLNNLHIAEEAYASAIKIDISFEYSMEAYFRLGVTYKRRGAVQTAMDCFEYIVHNLTSQSVSPSKHDVFVQIAHAHELQGQDPEAVRLLKEVLQANPRHERAAMLLAWLYYKDKNWVCSKESLTVNIPEEELSAFSWYFIGRCEQKMECFEDAYHCYHQAVKKDPKNHIYWNTIGTLYFTLSQFEDAMGAFKQASVLNPYFIEAVYNLGVVYEQFESALDSALEVYEKASEMSPDDRLILERIEDIEERKGREGGYHGEYAPPEVVQRDIVPNPTKTPYFLAHSLLGYKPTTFVFSSGEKREIDKIVENLHSTNSA
ncbi:hypothetical protein NEDG_01638 [Nematocida displodere]|uniref:Uncharacterized protein n=1 Tax=Nematocida displodere TaxID=1805483 RepID=A0A177EGX7_9MICR|nr:hypothetical protein NEDG_01638 [Nematocida displodere]